MTDREYDTSIAGLDMNGFGPGANSFGHEDCWMNPNMTTSEIGHNGIGLPTRTTHPSTPEPLEKNTLTLSPDQCQLLFTGKIIGIRIGSNPDVSPEITTLGIKIPNDLADTTMVSWSLHNAVVRKLEEQRNASRSSAQDAWAEVASIREKLKGHDDRMHKAALERENARAERDYERRRRQDDQGVWLETRDANKRLTEMVYHTEPGEFSPDGWTWKQQAQRHLMRMGEMEERIKELESQLSIYQTQYPVGKETT